MVRRVPRHESAPRRPCATSACTPRTCASTRTSSPAGSASASRSLVTRPALIVADEAVSALDVSVQAQVLNLMKDLQAAHGMAYLFISHDLAVVRYLCDDIVVLFRGAVVESGKTAQVLQAPAHPYTQELVDAMPRLGVRRRTAAIAVAQQAGPRAADAGAVATGCAYRARCPRAAAICETAPALRVVGDGRQAACHFA